MSGLPNQAGDARTVRESVLVLEAGDLATTLHPTRIPESAGQACLNCSRDRGVFELDLRYRQFNPRATASGSPKGFGLGVARDAKQFIGVHNGQARLLNTSSTGSADGTVSDWGAVLTNGGLLGSGSWRCWQFNKWLYLSNPDAGVKFVEIGQSTMETLYRNYDLSTSGAVQITRPAYPEWTFSGSDTIAMQSGGGTASFENDGFKFYDSSDPTGYQATWHEVLITLGASKDLSRTDYLLLQCNTLSGNFLGGANPTFKLGNSTHSTYATMYSCPVQRVFLSTPERQMAFWVDLTGVPRAQRTAVTKFVVGVQLHRDGPDGAFFRPFEQGGVYVHSKNGSKIDTASPVNAPMVEYAWTYIKSDGTSESGATAVNIPGPLTLGARFHSNLPYMGIHAKVSASVNSDPPYDATSKVRFYRKYNNVWYRIDDNTILNTGTPEWTDSLTNDELITKTVGNISIGTVDAGASGEVVGIDFGIQFGGSNIYFGGGRMYASRVDNPKDVLWDNITMDNATDTDLGRPRTIQADPSLGQEVLAAVAQDVLYVFTRHSAFYLVGDLPVNLSFPRALPGVQGVVGPNATCAFQDGALYASDDGLWFAAVPPTDGQLIKREELTINIRPTYQELIGDATTREAVVVSAFEEEVWVFCEDRFLHLTKAGKWVYGEWANGRKVIGAVTNPEIGLCVMLDNGSLGIIGAYKTDGGTNTAGSNGTAPSWEWTTRTWAENVHLLWARVKGTYVTAPAMALTGLSERNPSGEALTMTAAKDQHYKNFPQDHDHDHNGGCWVYFKMAGGANDVAYSVEVGLSQAESKQ